MLLYSLSFSSCTLLNSCILILCSVTKLDPTRQVMAINFLTVVGISSLGFQRKWQSFQLRSSVQRQKLVSCVCAWRFNSRIFHWVFLCGNEYRVYMREYVIFTCFAWDALLRCNTQRARHERLWSNPRSLQVRLGQYYSGARSALFKVLACPEKREFGPLLYYEVVYTMFNLIFGYATIICSNCSSISSKQKP